MVNGAPDSGVISPPPPGPQGINAAAPQFLAGLGPGGPVIYASGLPGPGAKERLVQRLLAGLPSHKTHGASRPLTLETTDLGQPRLFLGGHPGPAVSFSQAGGCLWAALAPVGQVGVDAALPPEFEPGYPLARAFQSAELDWARPLCDGDTASAAALLWALKEAAVKALGVGFHRLDPLAVEVFSPKPWQGGWRVTVQAGAILPAWVRPAAGGWLALARSF
jgi:4'-phosphopantetheinyl transferase superfamily